MDGCRALCGPQGTDGHMNALCRPAAMAGEAHLAPFRTQKLSPRAPMVLRRESVGEQDAAGQQRAFVPEREGSASALPSLCLYMRSPAEGPLHHAGALPASAGTPAGYACSMEALRAAGPPSLCSRPCAPCMRGLHPPGPAEAPSLRSPAIYAGQPLLPAHMPSRASPAGHLRACELCRNCAEAGMCWRRAGEERIVIPRAQAHPEIRDADSAANLENRILRSKRSEDRRERCYRQDSIRRFNSLRDMNPDRRELEKRDGGSIHSIGHASGHGHI